MGDRVFCIQENNIPKLAKKCRISTIRITDYLKDCSTQIYESGSIGPIEKNLVSHPMQNFKCIINTLTKPTQNMPQNSSILSPNPKDFIKFWDRLGLRKHRGTGTKVYKEDEEAITSLIKGEFFNTKGREYSDYWDHKFTLDDWRISTSRLALAATDKKYHPENKTYLKKLPLNQFLYDDFNRSGNDVFNSRFIYHLTNEPIPKNLFDPYKTLTDSLIEEYKKHKPQWNPTTAEKKIIMAASVKCHHFFSDNLRHISPYEHEIQYPYKRAQIVLDAITHKSNGIQPHYLLSDTLYTITLPQHLERIGIWLN